MATQSSPRGLIVDLVTPLKQNGAIDGRGLGRQLDRVLPHVQAVLIAGPGMGEGASLTAGQREELMEKTLVLVRGRVPVLVWITQNTEQETKQTLDLLSKRLKKRKCKDHVCWLDTPLYYHSNRGLFSYYRDLTGSTQEPWLLHNDPGLIDQLARSFKRNNIRTAILKEILEIKEIHGLLYLGSLDRAGNYQKATRPRPDFRIYDGDELRFLTHPSLSGVLSAGANLSPRAWSKITEASLGLSDSRGDYPDRLQQIWETGRYLRRLLDLYSSKAVQVTKQVLSESRILESPTCFVEDRDVGQEVISVIEAMKNFGDYPEGR
jgi:dihydrodipicolinate synthase/N-acetylneuraminate lyase